MRVFFSRAASLRILRFARVFAVARHNFKRHVELGLGVFLHATRNLLNLNKKQSKMLQIVKTPIYVAVGPIGP